MQPTTPDAQAPMADHDMSGMDHAATVSGGPEPVAAAGEHAGAEGGLPQFDFATWPGQIAWFAIIFFVMFLLMRYVFVPKIGGTIEGRDDKIGGDIAKARKLKEEADAAAQAAAAEMAKARAEAQKVASDARAKANAEIAAKLSEEEAKLAQTTAAAEARIAKARDAAMANVETIGLDTAAAIVERLTGAKATQAELSAAGRA